MKIPYTTEWCPHCETEHDIKATVKPVPKCPSCRKPLVPCSACDEKGCEGCTNGLNFKLHHGFNEGK